VCNVRCDVGLDAVVDGWEPDVAFLRGTS